MALSFCTIASTEASAQNAGEKQSTENVQPQKQDHKRNHKRGRNHRDMSPSKRVERMAKALTLDDKQKAELLAYYTQQDSLRKANRPQHGQMKEGERPAKPTEEQMAARKAEFEAQRAEEDAKLKSILTEDQYAKLQEMRSNQRERMGKPSDDQKGGHKGHNGAKGEHKGHKVQDKQA